MLIEGGPVQFFIRISASRKVADNRIDYGIAGLSYYEISDYSYVLYVVPGI
jgi:hypothetical protein